MPEELVWSRIEAIFNKFPASYVIQSLFLGLSLAIIYFIFMLSGRVEGLTWDPYRVARIFLTCFLISYLLIGNQYALERMRYIFKNLEFIPGQEHFTQDTYDTLRSNFFSSKKLSLIVLAVIIPAIIIDYASFKDIIHYFSLDSIINGDFSQLFDIYDYSIKYFFLLLIINILWIIYNTSAILGRIKGTFYRDFIKIDLFNEDKLGGLGQVANHIIRLIVYYSTGISIALLCYIDPTLKLDIIYLLTLLFAGIAVLIAGLEFLQSLFRSRMKKELEDINKRYLNLYEKLKENISGDYTPKQEDLQSVMKLIEALDNEREKREKLLSENKKSYSYSAVFVMLISLILPLFTLYEKMNEFGIVSKILQAFNITK